MKKPIVLAVIAAFLLAGFIIVSHFSSVKAGGTIQFGEYDWCVLGVRDGKALIITKNIIEQRPYDEVYAIAIWETCTLREYLNGEFLQKFTTSERERIEETRVSSPDNLWFGTNGGNDTTDKIFLLSLEEVDKYFGNSGDYQNKRRKDFEGQYPNDKWVAADEGPAFSNANDRKRKAKPNDQATWWWLLSPGNNNYSAASVNYDGSVDVAGIFVGHSLGGVRPALWLKL